MSNSKEHARHCEVVVLISYVNAGTIQVKQISPINAFDIATQTSLSEALEKLYTHGFVLQHADEVNVSAPEVTNNPLGIQYTFVKCKNNYNCWC